MRTALILTFIANLVLTAYSLEMLPERVAVHFGPGGRADGWASRDVHVVLTLLMHVAFFCLFYYSPRWVMAVPAKWVNIPNREFWLAPARRTQTAEMLQRLMWQFGTAFFLFFLVTGMLTIEAHRTEPPRLNEGVFLGALAGLLAYTAFWTVRFMRAFRLPARPHVG